MSNRSPNALEKKSQLERMLATKLFKKGPKLWELLKFLVESDLDQIPVDHYIVGIRVFDRREDWYPTDDNTVREGMRRLRILLENYYASDGIEDRLDLEFDQYKPVFSYNLRNLVERSLRLAVRAIGNNPKTAFKLSSGERKGP